MSLSSLKQNVSHVPQFEIFLVRADSVYFQARKEVAVSKEKNSVFHDLIPKEWSRAME